MKAQGWSVETIPRLALIALAAAAALVPLPAAEVEQLYSSHLYLDLQPWMTTLSNQVPVACLDLLTVALSFVWLTFAFRDVARRRSWPGALGRVALRSATWTAALYLAFLAAWGLNYRRVPLIEKLAFDDARVSAGAARDLGMIAVGEVNALHAGAHAELGAGGTAAGTIDPRLAAGFARAQQELGAGRLVQPARPKRTMFDPYLQRAGVSGMTDPFFLETLVAGDLLPIERPFVVAHEWSHLAGIADEGEANFVGWLTCLRGSPADRYSGWLFLTGELARAVRQDDRQTILSALAPGPREDLRAIARRMQQHVDPRISAAGWRAYNQYLRANRVERGTASYAEVVKLALGVSFDADWAPVLRERRGN
ncbi:MAG: DUF3810 family protein [Acidobacteria bacterium]|nr:DUF3810 family protein [Acidobacteriota bacterium]